MAPRVEELPERRSTLRTPVVEVRLRTVTPIYGGGVRAREVDRVDVIRVPSVRGQLRWWWRALFAGDHETPQRLFEEERRRFGGVGQQDEGRRSAVEVTVEVVRETAQRDLRPFDGSGPAYALWPARGGNGASEAERYLPGVELELRVFVDDERIEGVDPRRIGAELRDCVRAWILFGGYGGRTRRGLGSVTVLTDAERWLPRAATPAAIDAVFERERPLSAAPTLGCDLQIPRLAGAELFGGRQSDAAASAWAEAIGWLRNFRQGVESGARRRGHPAGYEPGRPGVSNWPEPDKIRRLAPPKAQPWSHPPRHNGVAAWPRAGFGLPIGGRFQTRRRRGDPTRGPYTEPDDFWLKWKDASGTLRERMASPLILKALPLVGGQFVPIALWLHRGDPPGGQVVLCMHEAERPGSAVPFGGPLVAPGDASAFPPVAGKPSLQRAFFDWLRRPSSSRRGRGPGAGRKKGHR